MFITIITVLFLSLVYNALPEEIQEKIRNWIKDTAKWAAVCGVAVGILFAMFIFLPDALAEELPDGFYYKVVFIDEVEEVELDRFDIEDGAVAKFLLHTDDLDHLWDYWDVVEEDEKDFVDYEFDRELSNIALYWIRENDIDVELDKEERIIRGRIVVLTMWECDPDDPSDEEVVDVHYTESVTE